MTRLRATKDSTPPRQGSGRPAGISGDRDLRDLGGEDRRGGELVPGNAAADGDQYRGWLLGHFGDPTAHGIRHTGNLEVKWGIRPDGQTRPGGWTTGETRTSLLLLVTGRWRLDLTVGTFTLDDPGDYVVWGPGIEHTRQAETDSTMLTIRWPSTS